MGETHLLTVSILVLASVVVWALTPVARALALRFGIVAVPNSRSVHTSPLPYLGGVAIYLGFVVAAAAALGLREDLFLVLVFGGGAILALGIIDDLRPLSALTKLLVEFAVAGVVVWSGVRIGWVTNPFGGLFYTGLWGIPLTMLWIVIVTNLVNVIDGLDGLAAGITTIVALTLLFACRQSGQVHTALLTAALAGSTLGFLPHNFNPAKIIMGDAGALFLGFTIAVISVEGPIKSAATVAMFVPVLALGVPILDAAFAVWRRAVSKRSVATADRDHLHHRLLKMGYSQRQAVMLMYSVSGFFGASAITLSRLSATQAALMLALVFSLAYFGARRAGLLGVSPEGSSGRTDGSGGRASQPSDAAQPGNLMARREALSAVTEIAAACEPTKEPQTK